MVLFTAYGLFLVCLIFCSLDFMLGGECMRVHFLFSSKNPLVQDMDGITCITDINIFFIG